MSLIISNVQKSNLTIIFWILDIDIDNDDEILEAVPDLAQGPDEQPMNPPPQERPALQVNANFDDNDPRPGRFQGAGRVLHGQVRDNDPRPGRFGGRGRVLHGQMRGRCYKCGLRGHRAATCDARAVCWLCGRRGHTKVVCPQRQGAQKTGAIKPTMQFTNCTFEKFNA
ncbi:ATP-dependent RNA helicase glh-1-like [Dendronephthya gigantea]|uniref:ATP-dependent RNA helicase glh-1-like n=1 Tax=Dendronephthya gigantea TaxID=151771 RepID=UPI00106C7E9A|nr:ATP-dependent RNA helicase glh-1-like [Dendronephthya gigantea]